MTPKAVPCAPADECGKQEIAFLLQIHAV